MINKPTGPSTEYIQKIHDYVDERGTEFNRNNLFRAHAHRGLLLKRLDYATNNLVNATDDFDKALETADHWKQKLKAAQSAVAFLTEDRDYWKAQYAQRRYRT